MEFECFKCCNGSTAFPPCEFCSGFMCHREQKNRVSPQPQGFEPPASSLKAQAYLQRHNPSRPRHGCAPGLPNARCRTKACSRAPEAAFYLRERTALRRTLIPLMPKNSMGVRRCSDTSAHEPGEETLSGKQCQILKRLYYKTQTALHLQFRPEPKAFGADCGVGIAAHGEGWGRLSFTWRGLKDHGLRQENSHSQVRDTLAGVLTYGPLLGRTPLKAAPPKKGDPNLQLLPPPIRPGHFPQQLAPQSHVDTKCHWLWHIEAAKT